MKSIASIVIVAALAAAAHAGSIGGAITTGGSPLASAEVRLWAFGVKGWAIAQTTTASGGGGYTFITGAGNYLVDARGPSGVSLNYGDRWYDVGAPNSGGYVAESADIVPLATASSTITGINIDLEVLGGADAVVVHPGGAFAPSMWVRMEQRSDPRIHHNDFSKNPTGLVAMRGLVPGNYAMIAYDPTGVRDTLLLPGPYSILSNNVLALGNLTMATAPLDPYEGNNTPNCGAPTISGAALHADPPQPWLSAGARVGPIAASDVDWYCFDAAAGDRLILTTSTDFTFIGATRSHPWTDPLLSFWRGARVTKLAEDDDGAGNLDARVDTGPLTAGCHCAAVTTFGDAGYAGAGQNSTGAYLLRVQMGNRPPVPSIKKGATELPDAPTAFFVDEGDVIALDLSYVDADHEVPAKTFSFVDATNAPVATATIALGATSGTLAWTVPPNAAAFGPYTMTLQAADAELSLTKTVLVVVRAVNMPPITPALVTPASGSVVANGAPTLTWTVATDPDGDVPTYDLELYANDTNGPPAQSAQALTVTSFTPSTIPENTRVSWRVRAYDGNGGLSPWSAYGTFLVDSANDPPGDPILLKPASNETLAMRRPGLSVLGVDDPEDDAVTYTFEITRDIDHVDVAWTSPPVPADLVSSSTMTSTGIDLEWGREYWARVRADDARGGQSAWSDAHYFRLKDNAAPGTPGFDGGCVATTFDHAPEELVVRNVVDAEGEQVVFDFRLFAIDADGVIAPNPIYQTMAPMSATGPTTAIPLDLAAVENGHYRYVVRAFDGTDYSDAIECEMTLDVPPPADGGCCDAGGRPFGAAMLGACVGLAALRRRRRT